MTASRPLLARTQPLVLLPLWCSSRNIATLWRPQGAINTTCPMGSSNSPCGLLEVSSWLRKAFLQRSSDVTLEEQRAEPSLLQSW